MKNIIILLLLSVTVHAQTFVLNVGTKGYVTVNGNNYARALCWSQYGVTPHGDTAIQFYLPNYGYIRGLRTAFLDGDNGNAVFTSALAVQTWADSNFEATTVGVGVASGGVGAIQLSDGSGNLVGDAASFAFQSNKLTTPSTFNAGDGTSNFLNFTNGGRGQSYGFGDITHTGNGTAITIDDATHQTVSIAGNLDFTGTLTNAGSPFNNWTYVRGVVTQTATVIFTLSVSAGFTHAVGCGIISDVRVAGTTSPFTTAAASVGVASWNLSAGTLTVVLSNTPATVTGITVGCLMQ